MVVNLYEEAKLNTAEERKTEKEAANQLLQELRKQAETKEVEMQYAKEQAVHQARSSPTHGTSTTANLW